MATATQQRQSSRSTPSSSNGADPAGEEWSLREEIIALIETLDDPTPEAVADKMLADGVPGAVVDDLVYRALREKARSLFGQMRRRASAEHGGAWADARVAYDILRRRENIGGVWKFLGDCTRADVLEIVEQYRERAIHMSVKADEYEAIANAMKKSKAETVAGLGAEKTLEVVEAVNFG